MLVSEAIDLLSRYHNPNDTIVITWWDSNDVHVNLPDGKELSDQEAKELFERTERELDDIVQSNIHGINEQFASAFAETLKCDEVYEQAVKANQNV